MPLSVRLTNAEEALLDAAARRTARSRSALVRQAVREFCQLAFACLGLDYQDYVVVDPALVRPPESIQLVADPRRAQRKLAWDTRLPFAEIVQRMVLSDLAQLKIAS